MKNQKFNKLIKAAIIAALTISFANTASAQTNFSGTWGRNDDLTDGGHLSINSIPVKLDISQDDKALKITRTTRSSTGETKTYTETLNFDGSAAEVLTPSKLKRSATAEWSADKTSLTERFSAKDEQGNVVQSGTLVFSLGNGGKQLQLKGIQSYEDHGEVQLVEVFDKQ